MDGHDIDNLESTQPYDPYSNEEVLTSTTVIPPHSTTAPHSGSSSVCNSPRLSNSYSSSLECDNTGSSLGSQRFDKDASSVRLEAAQRLFRVRSANTGTDGSAFLDDNRTLTYSRDGNDHSDLFGDGNDDTTIVGNKRKISGMKRNATDLTNLTSDWTQLQHYTDKPRFRGKINSKQVAYLEGKIELKMMASMDLNSVPSSAETNGSLLNVDRQFSAPSVDSMDGHYHSSFPSDHTLSPTSALTQGQSITTVITTVASDQVESTYPIYDYSNVKESSEDEGNDDHHLRNYSPEETDEFARQVSMQPSSTPIRADIPSTFPLDDLNTLKQTTDQFETDDTDTTPPRKNQNINKMPSPFLEEHRQQSEARSASIDQKKHTVIPSLRRLRSNSSLFDDNAAPISSSHSPPPCIMFGSTIDRQKYRRMAEAMGATIVTSWELCTHVVTDHFRRTPNLLCALASQKYVLSETWMKDSILKGQFEDEASYILRKQKYPNHFASKKLFFDPSAEIKRVDAHDLAKAAGAKVRTDKPNMDKIDPTVVVIYSTDETDKPHLPYQNAGYETISKNDFLDLYEQSTS